MMLLSTAAIGLTTAAAVSSTSAGEVEKKFAWSGHVNRVIGMADDGKENTLYHQDGNTSGSRARMKASAKTEDMTIGAVVELSMSAGATVSQHNKGSDSFGIRHSYVHVANSMGRLRIGDTAHAGEGFIAVSMDGTGNAENISGTTFDGIKFFNTTTPLAAAGGTTVGTANQSDFSSGRQSGISYDTPSVGGFKATISHTTENSGSGEVQYGGDFNGVKVKAGAMYTTMSGSAIDDKTGYGLGFKLPNGLSLAGNYKTIDLDGEDGSNDANNDDPKTMYGKIGYDMSNFSDFGSTSFAISHRKVEDAALNGDDFEMTSLLMVQNLKDYGTSVYGGFSNMSYDTTLANFDDITGFFMGAKVTF